MRVKLKKILISPAYALVPLSQGKQAIIDLQDVAEISRFNWYLAYGYACRGKRVNGKDKIIQMHRVINQTPDGMDTDHISRDRLDNRRANLRSCTRQENSFNRTKRKSVSSKFIGVCWHKRDKKWAAYITIDDKIKHLGYFTSEIEAALIYDQYAKINYGKFANLNF